MSSPNSPNPNRLIHEQSPYLLQHAYNPVDWYPWGEEAFSKAAAEDKPVFLSIGYSTCHWCHVMERESFENPSIAELLNRSFVAIKLDREERPDIDRIYMLFVQATTGSGGWPMSVFLTPDRKPFFGGTYFPPDNRYGRPGFASLLEFLARAWKDDRAKILESAVNVMQELERHATVKSGNSPLDPKCIDTAFAHFRRSFDSNLGGFGGAPKFPRPATLHFLLRYHYQTRNDEALEMVLLTLQEMAKGGMNDQMGGGFHRYSVDERWFVPHFEKMLYDQAQLALAYLEAFQVTRDSLHAQVARDIFEYVLRDMTHPEGGFYSAEDADSVIDPSDPHEKGEGAFYIWTGAEINGLLGADAPLFSFHYGVEPNGNVDHDPHAEFTGKNILFEAHPVEETAARFNRTPDEVRGVIAAARSKLMAARAGRIRPHLDDKILTSWNGLMISAFAKGAQVLGEPRYFAAAKRAAEFVLRHQYEPSPVQLRRRYREGDSAIAGFLDDYSFFANALIDLYETGFELYHLRLAQQLARRMLELFEDTADGGFFSTSAGGMDLVLRMKEDYDGAEPSGNSMAAAVLLRLGRVFGDEFLDPAGRTFRAFASRLLNAPSTIPQMMAAYLGSLGAPRRIVIAGDPVAADTRELLRAAHDRFLPYTAIVAISDEETRALLAEANPEDAGLVAVDGRATAYVCENFTCGLPTADPVQFAGLLG